MGVLLVTVGGRACKKFDKAVRDKYDVPKPKFRETRVAIPPELTGIVERVLFTALVAVDAGGYATAMMGWLGFKLAISWTWPELEEELKNAKDAKARYGAHNMMRASRLVSLLTGAVSLGFAFLAGLLIHFAMRSAGLLP